MIPVSRPDLDKNDSEAVAAAIRETYVAGGPAGGTLESLVAKFCNRDFGVGVTNGTAALHLAVRALDLPSGSKILLPALTIVSALDAVIQNGHIPVIVDVNPETWNVDAATIEQAVKNGIDAAIIVQTYSSSPPMIEISSLLSKAGVPFIEDAAEGFGGHESGQAFGSFGEMSILSFYANKLITTGEGGMVLTDNPVYVDRLRAGRNLHFDSQHRFIHSEIGGNFRLSNLQSTLGISQMARVSTFYSHRKKLYTRYLELLQEHEGTLRFQAIPQAVDSSYWVFPIVLEPESGNNAIDFIEMLRQRGIESRHFFYPLDRQPCLGISDQNPCDISHKLWQQGLYLPLGNGISETEVEETVAVVNSILRNR